MPQFDWLRDSFEWRDIPGCPGRSVLVGQHIQLDQAVRLAGRRFELDTTRDPLWLLLTDDGRGALLSYDKPDGSVLHTLNTRRAFSESALSSAWI